MTAKKKIAPMPVKVVQPEPLPVAVVSQPEPTSAAPTTTKQEDITKAGQRRINLIWEGTQAFIAILITVSNIYCAIQKIENTVLTNAFFLIVSMYFVRTNHQWIGGTGVKPANEQR